MYRMYIHVWHTCVKTRRPETTKLLIYAIRQQLYEYLPLIYAHKHTPYAKQLSELFHMSSLHIS